MAGPEISSLGEEKGGNALVSQPGRGGPDNNRAGLILETRQQSELHVDFLQERTTGSDHLHQLVSGASSYLNLQEARREGQQVAETVQLSVESHHSQN